MRAELSAEPLFEIDYAEVVDRDTFQPIDLIERAVILPVAVRLGTTRLLDNVQIERQGTAPARQSSVRG
jgi:pantoate--beta-alanine ligase